MSFPIGILGAGDVAQAIGRRLVSLGHAVTISARDPRFHQRPERQRSLQGWLWRTGNLGRIDSFRQAAEAGDLVINALPGPICLDVLRGVGADALRNKVLLDISNPVRKTAGGELEFMFSYPQSLGERIQAAFPDTLVVKGLNTIACSVMCEPQSVENGEHSVYICGNDACGKQRVEALLRSFGWSDIIDLGEIDNAAATEMFFLLGLRLSRCLGTSAFNLKVARGDRRASKSIRSTAMQSVAP